MKRRIIWAALLIATFVFFFFFSPYVVRKNPVAGGIGGFACAFFLVQLIADFRSFRNVAERMPNLAWTKRCLIWVIPAFVFIFTFTVHDTTLDNQELKKYGVLVDGTINDGKTVVTKRRNSSSSESSVEVTYYDKQGKAWTRNVSVPASEFSEATKGQHVKLVYSSEHPELIKPLISEAAMQEFTGAVYRDITLEDLNKIRSVPVDSVEAALNGINLLWERQPEEKVWVNERKKMLMEIEENGCTALLIPSSDGQHVLQSLDKNGFTPVNAQQQAGVKPADLKEGEDDVIYKNGDLLLLVGKRDLNVHGEGTEKYHDMLYFGLINAKDAHLR